MTTTYRDGILQPSHRDVASDYPMIFSIFKLFLNIHTHHQLLFILGPVTGFVSVHYSFKWCTVIGGLLAGLGMTMSSLTTSVELLLLTYSFVMGMVTKFKAPITD